MQRKILTELPKHLRITVGAFMKLSCAIRCCVLYLTHNTINKNFDKLALLYKINYISKFKNNSSFISTESHQPILPDYRDFIISLWHVAQYCSKSSSLSTVCRKSLWLANVLNVVIPRDDFHCLLM